MNLAAKLLGIRLLRLLGSSILCAAGHLSGLMTFCTPPRDINTGLLGLTLLLACLNQIKEIFECVFYAKSYSNGGFGGEIEKPGIILLLKELIISKNILQICIFGTLFLYELCDNFLRFCRVAHCCFMENMLSLLIDLGNINLIFDLYSQG